MCFEPVISKTGCDEGSLRDGPNEVVGLDGQDGQFGTVWSNRKMELIIACCNRCGAYRMFLSQKLDDMVPLEEQELEQRRFEFKND